MFNVRDAGAIKRFHTARVIKEESVAEHSFNVAMILLQLTKGKASRALILAALTHDLGEAATGDIPANIKTSMPETARYELEEAENRAVVAMLPYQECHEVLTEREGNLLHIADRLDGLAKCAEELRMGNRGIITIGERYCSYLFTLTDKDDTHRKDVQSAIDSFRRLYI